MSLAASLKFGLLAGFLAIVIVGAGVVLIPPASTTRLAEADHIREDLPQLAPEASSLEFIHPGPAQDVYVLLHGVTNTPGQFRLFGKLLHEQGANVFIPRMPFHGHKDRLTDEQRHFNAALALRETNRAIEQARPWGNRLTVVGLSVNGLPAAWVAMNRPEVDRAVLLAPFFSVHGMPDWLIAPAARFFLRWPNFFVWWDDELRENLGAGTLVYPRFATRTMASFLQFGLEIFAQARHQALVVAEVLIVTSGADQAINNHRVAELIGLWREQGAPNLQTYEFPAELSVPHDFIDPDQPDQQIDLVYPVLLKLLQQPKE